MLHEARDPGLRHAAAGRCARLQGLFLLPAPRRDHLETRRLQEQQPVDPAPQRRIRIRERVVAPAAPGAARILVPLQCVERRDQRLRRFGGRTEEPAFEHHQVGAVDARPAGGGQAPVRELVEARDADRAPVPQCVERVAGQHHVVGARRPARGQQRMHLPCEALALGPVEVEVVDRDRRRDQAARRRGLDQLRGEGRLAAALQARDRMETTARGQRIVQHRRHQRGRESVLRGRVRGRGHRATIAQ